MPKQGRENSWQSLAIYISSVFCLTALFPKDITSLIYLRNLRNSVKSRPLKMIYVTSGHVSTGILLTVPRPMFYSLFSTCPGYKNTLRVFCLHAFHFRTVLGIGGSETVSASHPKPAHLIWATHISSTCKDWAGGAVRTGFLTRCSLLLTGWLK